MGRLTTGPPDGPSSSVGCADKELVRSAVARFESPMHFVFRAVYIIAAGSIIYICAASSSFGQATAANGAIDRVVVRQFL